MSNNLEKRSKWWVSKVIVPIFCAIIIGIGGYIIKSFQNGRDGSIGNSSEYSNFDNNSIILNDKSQLRSSPQISSSPVCRLFPSDRVRPLRKVENEGHTWCEIELIKGRQCTIHKGFIYDLSIINGDCTTTTYQKRG